VSEGASTGAGVTAIATSLLVRVVAVAQVWAPALGQLGARQDLGLGRGFDTPQEPWVEGPLVGKPSRRPRMNCAWLGVHVTSLAIRVISVKTILQILSINRTDIIGA